jgi:Holliday junction resolvasome RuvABC endonuclease subunit
MKVLGIDPGLRNMAYCFMIDGKIDVVDRVDIFDGHEIVVKDTFDRVMKFMDSIENLTREADIVLVEKQFADNKLNLSTCLIVIQTVVQTLCRTKCVVVHALAIKRVYNTSMGEYRSNKQAAIKKAIEICPEIVAMFPKKKIDDVSDAFLLAHFGTYHLGGFFSKVPVSKYISGFADSNVDIDPTNPSSTTTKRKRNTSPSTSSTTTINSIGLGPGDPQDTDPTPVKENIVSPNDSTTTTSRGDGDL